MAKRRKKGRRPPHLLAGSAIAALIGGAAAAIILPVDRVRNGPAMSITRRGDVRLNQVTVTLTDYTASVAFYRTLGLALIVDSPPDYARFEAANGATFSVHRSPHPVSRGTVVYFECDDLDERVRALEAAGLSFEQPPRDESWLWREARLLDPAGNEVCLYSAGDNRRFPPWRVDGREG